MGKHVKFISFIVAVFALANMLSAQTESVFGYYSIELKEYGEATQKKIKRIRRGRSSIEVTLGDTLTQEDFAAFCKDTTWVANIGYSGSARKLTSLKPLENLKLLKKLTVGYWTATREQPLDLAPLSHAKGLEKLKFSGVGITNTDVLKGLPELKEISFGYSTKVDSLDFLSSLKKLEHLEFGQVNHFTDFKELLAMSY